MKWLFVFGMLLTGTINTLSKSWQNQQTSTGIDGSSEKFQFPWTQTLIMYCGESLCMIAFLVLLANHRDEKSVRGLVEEREINQTEVALLIKKDGDDAPPPRNKYTPFLFLPLSMLDLAGTTMAGIGLLYTFASVFQMLRGSIIVFSGLLSVIVLRRRLEMYKWIGIGITVCGLVLVGWSAMLDESGSYPPQKQLFGNLMIIAGQFANAIQFIAEEIFLKKRNFPPLLVVGSEGLWGVAMMLSIVLPILYFIPAKSSAHENALDAAVLIGNNGVLLALVLIYFLSIAFYNFCGLSVAKRLTSVHRTFIDALRTICVWGVQLTLYYATDGKIGEPWGRHSYLQLGGFVLLVCGTIVYNNVHSALYEMAFPKKPVKNIHGSMDSIK